MVFSLFKRTPKIFKTPIKWDVHSHLLYGIDDGAKSAEQTLQLAQMYCNLGFTQVTCTPHIMHGYYDNTPRIIANRVLEVNELLLQHNIPLKINFAAEYYADEHFLTLLKQKQELLHFKHNEQSYVLFETAFMNKPPFLDEIVFLIQSNGYIPVLAHPERYTYFWSQKQDALYWFNLGVHFQINLPSLTGYYSKQAQKMAEYLIENQMYQFFATDCHREQHLNSLNALNKNTFFHKIDWSRVLNTTL